MRGILGCLFWLCVFGSAILFDNSRLRAEDAADDCVELPADCLLAKARAALPELTRQLERDEVHLALTTALARLGRIDEAIAESVRIDNASTRADALGEIASASARKSNFDAAFQLAISAADGRIVSAQIDALETLATHLALDGNVDGAFDTVLAISNPYRRSQAQATIAVAIAKSGNISEAIWAASRIGMGYWFTDTQSDYKVASGVVARNAEFDHYWFYEALAGIAEIQCENRDFDAALQTAYAIPDLVGRSRALSRIAGAQASLGEIELALQTARRIDIAFGDRNALSAIAANMARQGDLDEGLTLAREIQATYGDGRALADTAAYAARSGKFESAVKIAEEIADVESSDLAWVAIASELARVGNIDGGIETLLRIADRNKRFDEALSIVEMLAREGRNAMALEMANSYADPRDIEEFMLVIVSELAAAGDTPTALNLAEKIRDPMLFALGFAALAGATVQ